MLTTTFDTNANCAVGLLIHYIFDLGGYSAGEVVECWLNYYPANWIRLAIIEALYQGRYKGISVEQILAFWQRRSLAMPHFNHEFERLVCDKIPQTLTEQTNSRATYYPLVLEPTGQATNSYNNSLVTLTAVAQRQKLVQSAETSTMAALEPSSQADRKIHQRRLPPASSNSATHQPIQQFNPEKTNASDFYTKLKAISEYTEN